jgi:fatty acid desaturase
MDDANRRSGGDDATRFQRTRDADLHRALRDEQFSPSASQKERSLRWIVSFGALPFMYIAGAVALGRSGLPPALQVVLAFFPVLAAQRTFLTLVHDASHKFYSADRKKNDLAADFLAAGFIGMLVRKYRKIHLAHHAANGSVDDPEFFGYVAVTRVGGWTRFIFRYALCLELASLLRKYHTDQDRYLGTARVASTSVDQPRRFEKLSIFVCQGVLAAVFVFLADAPHLYALWLYVAVTWSPLLSRLRFLAEHPGRGELTLSTRGRWWELVFFAPLNFNFHFEHHVWPSVPPYRLPAIHESLVASGFFGRHPEFVGESYVQTLSEYGTRWD